MKQQCAHDSNEHDGLRFSAGTIACKPWPIDGHKASFNRSPKLWAGVERELNLRIQVVFRNSFGPVAGVFSGFDEILAVWLSNADGLQIGVASNQVCEDLSSGVGVNFTGCSGEMDGNAFRQPHPRHQGFTAVIRDDSYDHRSEQCGHCQGSEANGDLSCRGFESHRGPIRVLAARNDSAGAL